jgi:hypothetical protein
MVAHVAPPAGKLIARSTRALQARGSAQNRDSRQLGHRVRPDAIAPAFRFAWVAENALTAHCCRGLILTRVSHLLIGSGGFEKCIRVSLRVRALRVDQFETMLSMLPLVW